MIFWRYPMEYVGIDMILCNKSCRQQDVVPIIHDGRTDGA